MIFGQYCLSVWELLALLSGGSGAAGLIILMFRLKNSQIQIEKFMNDLKQRGESAKTSISGLRENLANWKEGSKIDVLYETREHKSYSVHEGQD